MEWLNDIGRQTRRSLAQAARHTGGLMDHVGTAVDHVALAADSVHTTLMPSLLEEVQGDVAGQHADEKAHNGEHHCGSSRPSAQCSGGSSHKSLRALQVPGEASRREAAAFRRNGEGEEEPITYTEADEGADDAVPAAPMSRGLLGLGMNKNPR